MLPSTGGTFDDLSGIPGVAVRTLPGLGRPGDRRTICHGFRVCFGAAEFRIGSETVLTGGSVNKGEEWSNDGNEKEPSGSVQVVHAANGHGIHGDYIGDDENPTDYHGDFIACIKQNVGDDTVDNSEDEILFPLSSPFEVEGPSPSLKIVVHVGFSHSDYLIGRF